MVVQAQLNAWKEKGCLQKDDGEGGEVPVDPEAIRRGSPKVFFARRRQDKFASDGEVLLASQRSSRLVPHIVR